MSDSSYSKFDYNNVSTNENDELSQYLRIYSANSKPQKKRKNNLILNAGSKNIPTTPNFSLEYLPKNKILKNNQNFFKTTTQYTNFNKKEEKEKLERIKRDCKIVLNEKNKKDEKEEINKHSETDANFSIKCSVDQCEHHCGEKNYCSLNCVTIGTHEANPTVPECTDCMSFVCKRGAPAGESRCQ